ncbi:hypothetical protein S40293_10178 [Stachybotrys chartarum IBT 40293]|nr:hypothetical protein S40293_10178 [Stachybotrys chartarum IBT 40293]
MDAGADNPPQPSGALSKEYGIPDKGHVVSSISYHDDTVEDTSAAGKSVLEKTTALSAAGNAESLNDGENRERIMHQELEEIWILNLCLQFRDRSKREKFYVTYRQQYHTWRRVTVSIDYRNAPEGSLEADLVRCQFQRDKNAMIYEAIRDSLPEIQFYETVTNLRILTYDGRLVVHVVEDGNEIIAYPSVDTFRHISCQHVQESNISYESHMSGFVYKVRLGDEVLIRKDIVSPDTVDEFIYEVNAYDKLKTSPRIPPLRGIMVDQSDQKVIGFLVQYAEMGALIDVIYDGRDQIPPLSWRRRLKWAFEIVEGLADIHAAGYIHGDLTLSNVVLGGNGSAYLIGLNRRGCQVGWEPPEFEILVQNNQRVELYISVASDLYQLGMILWALATLEDEPETIPKPLVLPGDIDLPSWYRDIVSICLSSEPEKRRSARSLLAMFPAPEKTTETIGGYNSAKASIERSMDSPPEHELDRSIPPTSTEGDDNMSDSSSIDSGPWSIGSIATSVSSAFGRRRDKLTGIDDFIDLVYEALDLRMLVRSVPNGIRVETLRRHIHRLLKNLAKTLGSELLDSQYEMVREFFASSMHRLSFEISRAACAEGQEKAESIRKIPERVQHRRQTDKIIPVRELVDEESESESEAESNDEEEELEYKDQPFDISQLRDIVGSTHAFRAFVQDLRSELHPTFEYKLKRLMKTYTSTNHEATTTERLRTIASEVLYSRPAEVRISHVDDHPRVIRVCHFLGSFLQNPDGSLFYSKRMEPLQRGWVRLQWPCLCLLHTMSAQVPFVFYLLTFISQRSAEIHVSSKFQSRLVGGLHVYAGATGRASLMETIIPVLLAGKQAVSSLEK